MNILVDDMPRSSYSSSFLSENMDGDTLPPEIEAGNVEYKLKLIDPPAERFEHLVTQMKWRLAEGHGEAIYELGVSDNGALVGLTPEDLEASLTTLRRMGNVLKADVSIIRERLVSGEVIDNSYRGLASPPPRQINAVRKVAEVLVRKCLTDDHHFLEIRVAIVGGHDAGKSTLLGVLSQGELDNGRGKTRLNLLRHPHEIESGRTSSISRQIIGFNPRGELINYSTTNITTWQQICENASKVVTFLDTCGHPKYQRTTISGLTGHAPDYVALILAANTGGVSEVSREHLGLAIVLKVPVFVVVTKIDVATSDQLVKTLGSLLNLLKAPGIRMLPYVIESEDDVVVSAGKFTSSNVTGENLSLLTTYFNILPKPVRDYDELLEQEVEYQIEELYRLPGVGCVVGGVLLAGRINIHSMMGRPRTFYIGPDRGRFVPIQITSIRRFRCPVTYIKAGQAATVAIRLLDGSSFANDNPSTSSTSTSISVCDTVMEDQVVCPGHMTENGSRAARKRRRKSSPGAPPTASGKLVAAGEPQVVPQQHRHPSTNTPGDCSRRRHSTPMSAVSASLSALSTTTPITTANHLPDQPKSASTSSLAPFRLRRGQVILGSSIIAWAERGIAPRASWEFEAQLNVLYIQKQGVIGVGTQGVVFCGSVRQAVRVVHVHVDGQTLSSSTSTPAGAGGLKTGDEGLVRLRFANEPEWIKVGWTVLLRDGQMKCVGKVVR
ncbi:GTP binding protein, partial [Quaeritorhiza haematococci]